MKTVLWTLVSATLALSFAAVLAACAPRIDTRGNPPDPELLATVEVGHINKRGVEDLLGTPSSVAMFDDETWYYISERTETMAFFKPEVLERKVVILRFDQRGTLKEKDILTLDDSRDVQMVERKTPTAGNELGLLRQLFGNIGRFEGKGTSGPPGL